MSAKSLCKALIVLLLLWSMGLGIKISDFAEEQNTQAADAAIILGAAVYGDKPSPVFEERIRHGLALYRAGRVKQLIFTGGYGEKARFAEAEVARLYALRAGVPAGRIGMETQSHTTLQNLVEAKAVMVQRGVQSALIVSDPLHMFRAVQMAGYLGLVAQPSPTPSTRYRSVRTKADFLLREIYFTTVFYVARQ